MEYQPKTEGSVRLRGASSGALINGKIIGGSTACIRKALLRDQGVQMPVDGRSAVTFGIGHALEDVYAEQLTAKGVPYEREKFNLSEYKERGEFVVALDFVANIGEEVGIELKGISSTRMYEKVFIQGQYKNENLFQLVNSLVELEIPKGYLRYVNTIYTSHYDVSWSEVKRLARTARTPEEALAACRQINSMVKEKWKAVAGQAKKFLITFSESGDILVDEVMSGFTVGHVLDHRYAALDCLLNHDVYPDRPADDGPFSACGLCEYLQACDKYDGGELKTTEEFVSACRDLCGVYSDEST